ncbi:hypothetical protein V2J09_000708 [Rumex salicifolius]
MGATDHMIYDLSLFRDYKHLVKSVKVILPDGSLKVVEIVGSVVLDYGFVIHDVLLIQGFKHNLLSDPITKDKVIEGDRVGGLYVLQSGSSKHKLVVESSNKAMVSKSVDVNTVCKTFHERLGHCSLGKLKHLSLALDTSDFHKFSCESFILAKHCKDSFLRSNSIASLPYDLVHFDVWGFLQDSYL